MSQSDYRKRRNNNKLKKPSFSKQEIRKKIQMLQGKASDAYLADDIETAVSILDDIFLLRQQLEESNEG